MGGALDGKIVTEGSERSEKEILRVVEAWKLRKKVGVVSLFGQVRKIEKEREGLSSDAVLQS